MELPRALCVPAAEPLSRPELVADAGRSVRGRPGRGVRPVPGAAARPPAPGRGSGCGAASAATGGTAPKVRSGPCAAGARARRAHCRHLDDHPQRALLLGRGPSAIWPSGGRAGAAAATRGAAPGAASGAGAGRGARRARVRRVRRTRATGTPPVAPRARSQRRLPAGLMGSVRPAFGVPARRQPAAAHGPRRPGRQPPLAASAGPAGPGRALPRAAGAPAALPAAAPAPPAAPRRPGAAGARPRRRRGRGGPAASARELARPRRVLPKQLRSSVPLALGATRGRPPAWPRRCLARGARRRSVKLPRSRARSSLLLAFEPALLLRLRHLLLRPCLNAVHPRPGRPRPASPGTVPPSPPRAGVAPAVDSGAGCAARSARRQAAAARPSRARLAQPGPSGTAALRSPASTCGRPG